jgi:hypothetical protein
MLRYVRSHPAKILSAKAALLVLLAFQLVVGLQLQVANAAMAMPAPAGTQMPDAQPHTSTSHSSTPIAATTAPTAATTAHADCPMHDATNGATHANGGNKQGPPGNHDCCHVNACQCHCVYTPAAFALPLANVATSVALPSLSSAQFVAPRIDEFLRPPIA